MEKITIHTITDALKHWVENKIPIPPSKWLDGAMKLSILMSDLDDALIGSEMSYRKRRAEYIEQGETASSSDIKAKATDEYEQYLFLKAQKERVMSFIQICKKRTEQERWDN